MSYSWKPFKCVCVLPKAHTALQVGRERVRFLALWLVILTGVHGLPQSKHMLG